MKLVYLSDSTIPSRSANSVHVMKMCNEFSKNNKWTEVHLIAKHGFEVDSGLSHDFYGTSGFDIKLTGFKSRFKKFERLVFLIQSVFYAVSLKPDYLYSRNIISGFILCLLGYPIMIEIHSPYCSGFKYWLLKIILKRKTLKGVVVISDALCKIYKEIGLYDRKKFIVAHDAASWPNELEDVLVDQSFLNIGYAGHLYPGRGIDLIVKLAELLPNYRFHIVGGNNEDVSFWKKKSNAINNVFFHGYVQNSKIPSYLSSFDILVAPYQKKVEVEGGGNTVSWMSPLKIFEYMAAGKAIVVSDLPVLREVVNDKNSVLCDPENIDDWYNAILKISRDCDYYRSISSQAKNDFVNLYSWRSRANKLTNILVEYTD